MKRPRAVRVTERENPASVSLDTKSTAEILRIINREDCKVAPAVGKVLAQIARAVQLAVKALSQGGRIVYLGAGTSGRLGVLDAAECIPTFGTDQVVAVMAGAPEAIFRPVEAAEDDPRAAVRDLRRIRFNRRDVLVGISASGRTPYTIGGMRYARRLGAGTVALTANRRAPIRGLAEVAIVPIVGPEIIAGSTRLKAGTAQKLVLNMLSTATMVRLGRVYSHWMIHLQTRSRKLRQRAVAILVQAAGVSTARAAAALRQAEGKLPVALLMLWKKISKDEAARLTASAPSTAALLRSASQEALRTSAVGHASRQSERVRQSGRHP
jgi:N-acetylmuramic acid 6-phosphate etherase